MTSFDHIAESYYTYTPALPEQYLNMLKALFQVKRTDAVIDLGCGAGDIALAFAQDSDLVEGIDASHVMIQMAKKKDEKKLVQWINVPVEEFTFPKNKYHLITVFESFHLFKHKHKLIQQISQALKQNGFFAVGWAIYEWDISLKQVIEETFSKYEIFMSDEEGDWTCPTLEADIKAAAVNLTKLQKKEFSIEASTSIDTIVKYLLSVSKTSNLSEQVKQVLAVELEKRFLEVYPSGKSDGQAKYVIAYCQKRA